MDKKDTKTYRIIGAAMEVHGILGCGFLEAVYQQALAIEFTLRNIPFRREVYFPIYFSLICAIGGICGLFLLPFGCG